MAQKDRKSAYDDELKDAKWLVEGVVDEGYQLEDILTEFGGGVLPEPPAEVPEEEQPPAEEPKPLTERRKRKSRPNDIPHEEEPAVPADSAAEPETPKQEAPRAEPEPSVEELVSRAIDEVREEEAQRPEKKRRLGLFSRRKLQEDTEPLFQPPEPEEEPEEEPIGPEEPLKEVAIAARRRWRRQRVQLPFAAILTVLTIALMVVERQGIVLPYWSGDRLIQALVLGCTLAVVCGLCWDVFYRTVRLLLRGRFSCDLLASAAALVTLADCFTWPVYTQRPEVLPYAAPVCAALTAALWGEVRRSRAVFETCRTASVSDEPLFGVADTPSGACKELGRVEGFYTDLMKDEGPVLWQTALVPVIFMGTLVFAGLASLGKGLDESFLVSWSAVLTASCSLALPIVWTLPWSGLARQLQKTNCAVAGWAGARAISRQKALVLSDEDLFPTGTMKINGIKLYGEEMRRAVTYAASVMKETGSGLRRLFDDLLRGEGGRYMKMENFSFYEEGGWSADYRGETVLLGTASFMRKMDVRLPGNLNVKTGIFLAVDRQLSAVFAVKYEPAENVDWALKILKRNAVTPVLAARDPNITPMLLRRKFSRGVKVTYPMLAERLGLSELEEHRGRPRAMLLREGLLPYAEVVVGSLRCCKSAKDSALFALLGSAAGTLLTGYLVNLGAFALMDPLTILVFLALWLAPALLFTAWAGKF